MIKKATKDKTINIIFIIIAILIGLVIAFPVIYCYISAFKSRAEFSSFPPTLFPESFLYWDNFVEAWSKMNVLRLMLNSLIVATMGTVVKLICATFAAYAFVFYEFKGKNFLFFVVLGTMMLPGDTLLVQNFLTVSQLGLINTYLGMCIIYFVGAANMFMLRQNFKTIPRDFREAASLDGCGDLKYLFHILVPISKPIFITLGVQSFISLWNTYLWPLMVTNVNEMRTVQVGITTLTGSEDTNYNLVLAGVAIIMIPSFILFGIMRKNIVDSMTAGALVG